MPIVVDKNIRFLINNVEIYIYSFTFFQKVNKKLDAVILQPPLMEKHFYKYIF